MLFLICDWESENAEDRLYALICTFVYKVLEHPWILVSIGDRVSWNQSPTNTKGQLIESNLGRVKYYMWFSNHTGVGFPPPTLFKGQL